jgi:hypothetical protein
MALETAAVGGRNIAQYRMEVSNWRRIAAAVWRT